MLSDPADQRVAMRLAGWAADPAGWYRGGDGLPDDLRDELARNARLRPLLNDWLAGAAGLRDLPFTSLRMQDGHIPEETRLAVEIVTATEDELRHMAQFLGAALWSDRLRRTVLRTEREALVAELGADAMAFGLRRAPLMARSLAGIEMPGGDRPVAAGLALAGALVARAGGDLLRLFRLRLPELPDPVTLTAPQVEAARAVLSLRGETA